MLTHRFKERHVILYENHVFFPAQIRWQEALLRKRFNKITYTIRAWKDGVYAGVEVIHQEISPSPEEVRKYVISPEWPLAPVWLKALLRHAQIPYCDEMMSELAPLIAPLCRVQRGEGCFLVKAPNADQWQEALLPTIQTWLGENGGNI